MWRDYEDIKQDCAEAVLSHNGVLAVENTLNNRQLSTNLRDFSGE